MKRILWIAISALIAACSSAPNKAPVVERRAHSRVLAKHPRDARPSTYIVQKGDTLFSIALEHGLDYKDLAQWNDIEHADQIKVGRELRLAPSDSAVTTPLLSQGGAVVPEPLKAGTPKEGGISPNTEKLKVAPKPVELRYSEENLHEAGLIPAPQQAKAEDGIDWGWPASGKITAGFSENSNLKGIDISGTMGDPILAAAPGRVIYTGNVRGYGKLIVIKHNKTYLSVYAHNSKILVKEGGHVEKGERIGEMGDTDANQVVLHFEIRRLGKSVDPMTYLKHP